MENIFVYSFLIVCHCEYSFHTALLIFAVANEETNFDQNTFMDGQHNSM